MNTYARRKGAIASGILIIAFPLLLLVMGLSDFDQQPGAALLAAALAFVGGLAASSSCYWMMAERVRPKWTGDSRLR